MLVNHYWCGHDVIWHILWTPVSPVWVSAVDHVVTADAVSLFSFRMSHKWDCLEFHWWCLVGFILTFEHWFWICWFCVLLYIYFFLFYCTVMEACFTPISCRWSADANGGTLESLGYKEGFRVDVDIPDGTWAEAPSFHDILIFNTGHW